MDKTCKQCGVTVNGKAVFCSDKCRMRFNRTNKTSQIDPRSSKPNKVAVQHPPKRTESQPEQPTRTKPGMPYDCMIPGCDGKVDSQQFYCQNHLEARARRTAPDKLNWGTHMTPDELHKAGLKGNRVPIPGDWDYVGVAC